MEERFGRVAHSLCCSACSSGDGLALVGAMGAARSLSSGRSLTYSAVQVRSRVHSAHHTERHPGQRLELDPWPPDSTEAACPSARAPAPTPGSGPEPADVAAPSPSLSGHTVPQLPFPAGTFGQLRPAARCTQQGGRGAHSEAGGVRKSGPPQGRGARKAGGEGVRSAAAP